MTTANLWQASLIVAVIGAISIALWPTMKRFLDFLNNSSKEAARWGIVRAETGWLVQRDSLSEEDLFQLEKRAFFSKTWLFVCHRSRFEEAGDYNIFDVGGIAFFGVLGQDGKIRAFQNICRHRAYTVVRKECGTSTRFSCRYHGWQYDDQGKLVKAPKFENSPGFIPEENGLFEIKLIVTRDGLIFVNFDETTMNLPFNNVESGLDMKAYRWLDGSLVKTAVNWKVVGNDFLGQAHWSRIAFGWLYPQKAKAIRLLGPLSIAKDLDDHVWATMTLVPTSASASAVRIDLYSKPTHEASAKSIQKWKWMLEQEVTAIGYDENKSEIPVGFSYECGGRMIDLSAILGQHQRSEKLAKRKLFPAIRVTGFDRADQEATALCNAIDGVDSVAVSRIPARRRGISFTHRLEW